ncbi:putative receptor-like protein kinase At3g47110 [Sorghum bicolor]|uniref:putative receptor-like protein kinase At3g47110 n=1 Tax=Sorghum bicolor TaxID=4558 RepID=UPI000B423DD3|nr:putative receptor-like protein kinase At3g47110 [Sorghum bicolor]|eukprot:XP_021317083.1 putative receptor-like protein kinase At3g47110 [Sorghum bicolor]
MAAKEYMKFAMLMPWATIMLLLSCGAGTINCMTLNGNDTDFISLLDFKHAIMNDPKGALSSWNTTTHFCSWEGVVCSRTRPERVVMLNLSGQALEGHISPSLGNMSYLISLELSRNKFYGQIPPNLGYLHKLKHLGLGNNSLQGNIPDAVTNCSNLLVLDLQGNLLVGEIPKKLALLSNLLHLRLNSNNFSGAIPPDLGNITTLEYVYIHYNQLHGSIPEELGKLSNMSDLSLGGNMLSGRIPEALFNLSLLQQLAMPLNMLHGPLPSKFGDFLPSLQVLLLGGNMLGGHIPDSLGNASELQLIDLGFNYGFTGKIPPSLGKLWKLRTLNLSSNKLTGEIPPTLGTCQQLQTVILDSNFLSGSIPALFGQLGSLTVLNLSRNNFSGSIPISLSKLQLLTQLDLSHNHLDGEVPTEGVFTNTTAISLDDNWQLCGGVLELHMPPCPNPMQKRIVWRHYFVIIAIPVIGIVSLTLVIYFIISRRKVPRTRLSLSFSGEQFPKVSYKDLAQATDNFTESSLVGRGSHGSVYKGRLITPEPMVVAVKVFDLAMEGTNGSFISECQALRNIRHRNLVPILTACSTIDNMGNDFKALVYRFMPNGSLDTWLHSPGYGNLDLSQRLKIIVDIADALRYIHHDCETPIIHCDLKPSNILLDDNMGAHLADFGIARFYLETISQTVGDSRSTGTINLKGTIGYISPEYAGGSFLSTCGDVYSFGVVLMEMLTGKRPTDPLFCNGLSIISFCKTSFPDQVLGMVDAHLLEEYQECARGANLGNENRVLRCLLALVKVALSCTCEAPGDRISMREAAAELHKIKMSHCIGFGGRTVDANYV